MKKVVAKWVIALTPNAKLIVKKGDRVVANEVLAEERLVKEQVMNLSVISGKEMPLFLENVLGKHVEKGEILYETKGIFRHKVLSLYSGKIVRGDEFNNIYIQNVEEDTRLVKSPVEATVESFEDNKITLKFTAEEFPGVGHNEGREWAYKGIKEVNKLLDMTAADADKVILLGELSSVLITKAEVVGVKGIVIRQSSVDGRNDRINSKLPILKVSDGDWGLLTSKVTLGQRAMINATGGRLLLVI